jgi:hypothetical protein
MSEIDLQRILKRIKELYDELLALMALLPLKPQIGKIKLYELETVLGVAYPVPQSKHAKFDEQLGVYIVNN